MAGQGGVMEKETLTTLHVGAYAIFWIACGILTLYGLFRLFSRRDLSQFHTVEIPSQKTGAETPITTHATTKAKTVRRKSLIVAALAVAVFMIKLIHRPPSVNMEPNEAMGQIKDAINGYLPIPLPIACASNRAEFLAGTGDFPSQKPGFGRILQHGPQPLYSEN